MKKKYKSKKEPLEFYGKIGNYILEDVKFQTMILLEIVKEIELLKTRVRKLEVKKR